MPTTSPSPTAHSNPTKPAPATRPMKTTTSSSTATTCTPSKRCCLATPTASNASTSTHPTTPATRDWVYNDNVNSPLMRQWLTENAPIDNEDLERHDKWLCMMWPRLHLLKELLADDGVIFISIDNNEQHHLRMLMDEIFGGENFIESLIWRSRLGHCLTIPKPLTAKNTATLQMSMDLPLLLCKRHSVKWNKSKKIDLIRETEGQKKHYDNGDKATDEKIDHTMYYPIHSDEFVRNLSYKTRWNRWAVESRTILQWRTSLKIVWLSLKDNQMGALKHIRLYLLVLKNYTSVPFST